MFERALLDWLRLHVGFDHCVVFGYRGAARPPMLFETFSAAESYIYVALYQEGPYLLDPFYHAAIEGREGFWRMRELAPDRFYTSEYYRSYYTQTGLAEEAGFFVQLPESTAVVLSLMRLARSGPFGTAEVRALRDLAPLVLCLCGQHWKDLPTARSAPDRTALPLLPGSEFDRARLWASQSLTGREGEIVNLVLQGHSSESIGRALGISVGTVKVHRRNIHQKLGIHSQAGLFARFIELINRMA
ncbi:helix-turn-helix transcriptional regulator [Labrys monachus]|uniref:DNA-binding CsgD family transcriptional regulator n=1 Tax=Labrys monachus TaxID=217067 RepID=A0ABU0FBD9_9HYPH|nr:helix-turn-helix transcriptional regulator [Labrys monachus]MDQ0391637.1 DNA-binding CsgD family transcriptional regulator [Labrys monachus]